MKELKDTKAFMDAKFDSDLLIKKSVQLGQNNFYFTTLKFAVYFGEGGNQEMEEYYKEAAAEHAKKMIGAGLEDPVISLLTSNPALTRGPSFSELP